LVLKKLLHSFAVEAVLCASVVYKLQPLILIEVLRAFLLLLCNKAERDKAATLGTCQLMITLMQLYSDDFLVTEIILLTIRSLVLRYLYVLFHP
jgi:hypothetical protein